MTSCYVRPVCIFEMLNTILIECFAPYRPKLYVQHFIEILLKISKIYTPTILYSVGYDVK